MNIYDIRKAGREFCQTEGSEHYKSQGKIEPIELTFSVGHAEGFCIGNILKYAARFPKTQNLQDLKKASDYAQILVGLKLGEQTGRVKCLDGYCSSEFVKTKQDAEQCKGWFLNVRDNEWFKSCPRRSGNDD